MIEPRSTISEKMDSVYGVLHPILMTSTWLFTLLAIIIVFILILVQRKRWAEFAIRRKRRSRIILFILTFILAVFLPVVGGWSFRYIPVQLAFESPNSVATAIKLGLYGLYINQEESQLMPERKSLLQCVDMVSFVEAEHHQKQCENDRACIENIPAMSREDIISKIRESQKSVVDKVSDACKNVDVPKL